MGYESKLYVVDKGTFGREIDGKMMRYGEVIAHFELSKVYDISGRMREYPATDCFIYDGDEEVTEDKYGRPLTEIPIADAIAIIEESAETDRYGYGYRRYEPCLGLLKGFNTDEWCDLVVLHYGH